MQVFLEKRTKRHFIFQLGGEERKFMIFSPFTPQLENKMPFGPLLWKNDNFSLLTPWLDIWEPFFHRNEKNIFRFTTCWRIESPNDENRRKNIREFFLLSLYGDLKGLLGTPFSKILEKILPLRHTEIRRAYWGGVFWKKLKNFSLTPQLENKMPFGPLFEKTYNFLFPLPKSLGKSKNSRVLKKYFYPSTGRSQKRQKFRFCEKKISS